MDRLDTMKVFAAVADSGSFAAAARRLDLSPPATTRAVAALETSAAGAAAAPAGLLTLTAPVTFGRLHVAPVVSDFLAAHPEVSARLLLVDRMVDLIEEGTDAAIRIGALPDSSLQARRLGEVRRQVVAAPLYLRRHGTPRQPRDLARHRVIVFGGMGAAQDWRFGSGKSRLSVRVAPVLAVNDAAAAIALAVRGDGVTRVLSYQAAEAVAARRLVVLLERSEPAAIPVQLVHPAGRFLPAKTRAFIDFAAPRLRAALGS